MNWHGYIKRDGTCLITPLLQNHEDVLAFWAGPAGRYVVGHDGSRKNAIIMAEEHGAKRFVLHDPPNQIMVPLPDTDQSE